MKKMKYSEVNYKHACRKVTKSMATKMAKKLEKGYSYNAVAEEFGVSASTVKYNTDPDYRQWDINRHC